MVRWAMTDIKKINRFSYSPNFFAYLNEAHRLRIVDTSTSEIMMMSSNGNLFRVTGHLCGEFTGWITHTKASDAELWCLLWSAPE